MIAEDVPSTSPANSLFLMGCVAFPLDMTRPEPITLRDGKLLHVTFYDTTRNLSRLVDFAEHLFGVLRGAALANQFPAPNECIPPQTLMDLSASFLARRT